jgi:hypothetical protein
MKKSSVFEWHKCFKEVARMWKIMKTVLITFFDIKNIVHFEFILQGQQSSIFCLNTEVVT